jgi:hypothetical protein
MVASRGKSGFWRSVAVLACALAFAGGSLVIGEGSDEARADGPREPRGGTVEDLVGEVEDTVPGFAGMFVDEEQDVLYVYSVDPSALVRAAAEEAMTAAFGDRLPVSRIQVLPARYGFPGREERNERLSPEGRSLDPRTVVEARVLDQGALVRRIEGRSQGTLAPFLDLSWV